MAAVRRVWSLASLALLSACAGRHDRVTQVVPPQVVPTLATMPAGGYRGMVIPAPSADGRYPTPSDGLTAAAASWHLRAALNVAALACRGPEDAMLTPRYNAMLTARKAELAAAEQALAAEYRAGGGDWRDRYDDAMTRLYNFYAQSFARDGFCRAAGVALEQIAAAPTIGLASTATVQLAAVDRPFVDFYRAYDKWRMAEGLVPVRATLPPPVIAVAAAPAAPEPVAAPAPAPARRQVASVATPARRIPWLTVDVAALPPD